MKILKETENHVYTLYDSGARGRKPKLLCLGGPHAGERKAAIQVENLSGGEYHYYTGRYAPETSLLIWYNQAGEIKHK